jgi:FtsP/CotA-like multicopper oxidase with cupredoxin domain
MTHEKHRSSSMLTDRRMFMAAGAASAAASLLPLRARAQPAPLLRVASRTIEVLRKPAKVFSVLGPNGRNGHLAQEGDRFTGDLLNASEEPLQMHWHGQIRAAAEQDRARPGGGSLPPGQTDRHDFELTPGTHWMHSHTLSEQRLLAAPMVTREKDAGDVQDIVVMLHDFAFRSPQEILAELGGIDAHAAPGAAPPSTPPRGGRGPVAQGGGAMHGPGMMHGQGHGGGIGHGGMGMTHANDVRYDAYLANDRTLDDPEVVQVSKGGRVRLRIINGGTASAFWVSVPGLKPVCVAVDGSPCRPLPVERFPLAQGQRVDLLVTMPAGGGAFAVLAQVEAARFLTGVVLATSGAPVRKLTASAASPSPMVDLQLETRIQGASALPQRRPDRAFMLMLGEEPGYRWTINGRIHGEHEPLRVKRGERVELTFMNPTMMMHPMHLHGHHFQVVGIGGRRLAGAVRDTIAVPGHLPVTVAFDATHAGSWFLHCHHLYHMATGMMTEVEIA